MDRDKLMCAVAPLGITLTGEQCEKLIRYYEMVIEKNKVMNLTAITDEEEFLYKHFVDSLSVVRAFEFTAAGAASLKETAGSTPAPGASATKSSQKADSSTTKSKSATATEIRPATTITASETKATTITAAALTTAAAIATNAATKEKTAAAFETETIATTETITSSSAAPTSTSTSSFDDVDVGDTADAVDVHTSVDAAGRLRVIDVGTGAGFPGLVLKIVFPGIDMTLFDSLKKRLMFLEEVIDALGLDRNSIRTLHGRAEDLGQLKAHRGSYDLVLARAVANLSTLSEYCLPLVRMGGRFIAYKTEAENADAAVKILGGKSENVTELILPGTEFRRTFLTIRKVKETPKKYPRKAGTPSKEPL